MTFEKKHIIFLLTRAGMFFLCELLTPPATNDRQRTKEQRKVKDCGVVLRRSHAELATRREAVSGRSSRLATLNSTRYGRRYVHREVLA